MGARSSARLAGRGLRPPRTPLHLSIPAPNILHGEELRVLYHHVNRILRDAQVCLDLSAHSFLFIHASNRGHISSRKPWARAFFFTGPFRAPPRLPALPGRQSRAGSLSLSEKCATCPAWPGRRPRRGTSLRATGSARLGVDWNFQSGSPHQSQISSTSHWKASVRFSPSLPAREVTARNSSPRNLRRKVLSSPEVFPSKTHR